MDKISIIIPTYNPNETLDKSIDSCLEACKKVYDKFKIKTEILLINDGSKEGNPYIEKYKNEKSTKETEFIFLENAKNSGVSETRNHGLRKSTGNYILFVDGDDYINEDAIYLAYQEAKEYDADAVEIPRLFSYIDKKGKICNFSEFSLPKKNKVIKNFNKSAKMFANLRYVTGVLYKKKIIGDTLFDIDLRCYEDTVFNFKLRPKINTYVLLNRALYVYFQSYGSLSNSDSNRYFYLIAIERIREYYEKNNYFNLNIEDALNNNFALNLFAIMMQSPNVEFSKEEIKRLIPNKTLIIKLGKMLSKVDVRWKNFFFKFQNVRNPIEIENGYKKGSKSAKKINKKTKWFYLNLMVFLIFSFYTYNHFY